MLLNCILTSFICVWRHPCCSSSLFSLLKFGHILSWVEYSCTKLFKWWRKLNHGPGATENISIFDLKYIETMKIWQPDIFWLLHVRWSKEDENWSDFQSSIHTKIFWNKSLNISTFNLFFHFNARLLNYSLQHCYIKYKTSATACCLSLKSTILYKNLSQKLQNIAFLFGILRRWWSFLGVLKYFDTLHEFWNLKSDK